VGAIRRASTIGYDTSWAGTLGRAETALDGPDFGSWLDTAQL
jgi:hypothetical protein